MAASYSLTPVKTLGSPAVDDIRRIYESGFAPHLRAGFDSITSQREPGELGFALLQNGQPRGFAMLRPLGATGWIFLRYFVVDATQRGQGLGGIMWDELAGLLRAAGYALLVFDVDDPDEPGTEPDEVQTRLRRIAFYQRHGAAL